MTPPTGSARELEREEWVRVGEGDGRRERGAARPANSDVEPACDARSAANDEDCEVGAGDVVRAAAICRAMAVREEASRAPFEEKRCRGSGGG